MSSQKKRGTKRKIRSVSGRVPVGRNNTKKMHSVRARTNMNNLANAFAGMYINKRRKPKTKKNKPNKAYQRAKQATQRSARAARRSYLKSKTPARKSVKKGRRSGAYNFNNMMKALENI